MDMMKVSGRGVSEEIARLRHHAAILEDFGRLAADALGEDDLLGLATLHAARGTGSRHAAALRHRPKRGDLLLVAGVGWEPGIVGYAVVGAELASLPWLTFRTGQPAVANALPGDPTLRWSDVLQRHGIVSAANAPVLLDGEVWGVLEVDSDIPRRIAEDDVRFLRALAGTLGLALAALARRTSSGDPGSLEDAQVLLRELQHRSKNDLQLILSLLVSQRRQVTDEATRRRLTRLMDRITAIGVAYDQLSHGATTGAIGLDDYLGALCRNLAHRSESVRITTDLDPVSLPHVRAVPLGLVVNELVTNALKHAFPDGAPGTVKVGLRVHRDVGEVELTVADDGAGMGPPRPGSSGSELVRRLVGQVGGLLERPETERGTAFRITFPAAV